MELAVPAVKRTFSITGPRKAANASKASRATFASLEPIALDEEYVLTDEDREVIASDIKDMNSEDFESYSKKLTVLLKEKSREVLAKKDEELAKLKAEEAEKTQKEEVKASVEETDNTTVIEDAVEEAQEEDSEDIPNSTTAEEGTLTERYQKAFTLDQFELK